MKMKIPIPILLLYKYKYKYNQFLTTIAIFKPIVNYDFNSYSNIKNNSNFNSFRFIH